MTYRFDGRVSYGSAPCYASNFGTNEMLGGITFTMKLGLRDERLPNWAHTAIILLIVSFFAVLPAWWGISAIVTGHLPRSESWDGDHWFGGQSLSGGAAVIAGCCLGCLSLSFLALGFAQLRCAEGRRLIGALPWFFVALSGVLYLSVGLFK